jgi:hypothetical protein
LEGFIFSPSIDKCPKSVSTGVKTLAQIALLLGERRFQNPGEEFLMTLPERFLNGIL